MSDLLLGGLGILFSRLNGESMYLDTTVSVEPSSLKLDSDYSLIYEYIIDDIYIVRVLKCLTVMVFVITITFATA